MNSLPETVTTQPSLDFELCEMLGENSCDCLVLLADGQRLDFVGTPIASPAQIARFAKIADELNEQTERWADWFIYWKIELCEQFKLSPLTAPESFRPKFSFQIHRVCAGYCENEHLSIPLIAKASTRVPLKGWQITQQNGGYEVILNPERGAMLCARGNHLASTVARVVSQLLRMNASAPLSGATGGTR